MSDKRQASRPTRTYGGRPTRQSRAVAGTPDIRDMMRSLSAPGSARPVEQVQASAGPPHQQQQQQLPVHLATLTLPTNILSESSRRRAISSSILIRERDVRKSVRELSSSPPIGQPTQQRSRINKNIIDSSDNETERVEDQILLDAALDAEVASNDDQCTPQSDVDDNDNDDDEDDYITFHVTLVVPDTPATRDQREREEVTVKDFDEPALSAVEKIFIDELISELKFLRWNGDILDGDGIGKRERIIAISRSLSDHPSIALKTRKIYGRNADLFESHFSARFNTEGVDCPCGEDGCLRLVGNCQFSWNANSKTFVAQRNRCFEGSKTVYKDSNHVEAELRKSDVSEFLDHLGNNLADNDVWLEAPNVVWYPNAKNGIGKWKPARKSAYHFVLRRIDAHLDGIPFVPSLSAHLVPLAGVDVQRIVKKVKKAYDDGTLVGEMSGMKLAPFSHSDLVMLSVDRRDSSKAVNEQGQQIDLESMEEFEDKHRVELGNSEIAFIEFGRRSACYGLTDSAKTLPVDSFYPRFTKAKDS
ncbi:hypothetical protein HK100_002689 [Physocladia obscura]|uniref:Uncharacterized protein n=1 Tax=Physocladia obscura TaxID=109957 RepID=A0AAD5XAW9_9FUNG|nr:hypothetical protein HK100_002689 [Physocladia obscura]